jgi:hypothetical protein
LFSQTSAFLDSLLRAGLPKYQVLLNRPAEYKLQVIYTRIDRDEKNVPAFTDYLFHVNSSYIYPASTVKLPISILALGKLEALHLDKSSVMITDSAFYCQKKITQDTSTQSGYPSLENYIKKMLLVSDNSAFARTYEFVGYDYAHEQLARLDFKSIRLLNRLDGQCPGDTAKVTPPVYFLNAKGDTVYRQELAYFSGKGEHPVKNSTVGNMNRGGKDFSRHNYLPPADLHRMMKLLVFNDYAPARSRLPLSRESRLFMLKQLGLYPRESDYPAYDKKVFYDSYKKYLVYGAAVATIQQDTLRVINIVGRAYGFLIDCAYIIDLKNKVEFLLTACVYVNAGGRVGSGKYEYDRLGLPFMKDLGLCVYRYERQRKKKHAPDLGEFKDLFELSSPARSGFGTGSSKKENR